MAGEAVNIKTDAWLREDTRATILVAARSLFDKGGVDALSLSAVASEAGFAPPTVYAYFTNKNDLLVATVANDLADLARAMRDVYSFSESETFDARQVCEDPVDVASATICSQPNIAASLADMPTNTGALSPDAVKAEPRSFASAPEEDRAISVNLPAVGKKRALLQRREIAAEPAERAAKSEEPILMPHPERSQEETHSLEPQSNMGDSELASLKESVAKLETRKVDAWLERRLRIFEKTLNDLETRVANSDQASTRASALSEETSKILTQRLEGAEKRLRDGLDSLAQRLEQSEKRPRGMPPDLRATINDLYARLESLELGHNAKTPATALEAQWSSPPEEAPNAPEISVTEEQKPMTAAAETYLTAARRAASAAAQLAEMEKPQRRFASVSRATSRKRLSRSNLMMMLCGAIALLLVVYGFILRDYFNSQTVPPVHTAIAGHALALPPSGFDRVTALANRGDIDAELTLGLDYVNGTGVAKDATQAARWLQLAAEHGDPVGQYWYGTLFERGLGVKMDPAQAFRWYQAAAIQGNRHAIYNVAIAYAVGRGSARDITKAADWFRRAADLGYVDAQYNLAVLYERGDGVPQSLVEAYKWYAIAAASGDGESKSRIAAIATQLGPDDLSAAQSAANSFKPEPINRAANLTPTLPARV